jgi:antitoxin (DNA-binding transcriptional repressor) of toxin-antitoxin stability system
LTALTKNKNAIGVTAFKAQCLGLIDEVAQGKTDRIVLLKHNKPVAAIVPIGRDGDDPFELWGAMRDTIAIAPGVDLTDPLDVEWEANK